MKSESKSYLTFKVGKEFFATDVVQVQHIMKVGEITKVPHSEEHILGVFNLRGQVLPVVDTSVRFNMEPIQTKENTSILVLDLIHEKETYHLGAVVDTVLEVLEVFGKDLLPLPDLTGDSRSEFITGLFEYEDQLVMILDMNLLFSKASIENVNSYPGNG